MRILGKFFLYDFPNVSKRTKKKFSFDKENSYYNYIKSFPENSEIDVSIHYISTKYKYKETILEIKKQLLKKFKIKN